jgi:isopenicillin N synthase-like dioxygenase
MSKFYELQNSEIIGNKLVFEKGDMGFKKALLDGFFFLKSPENLSLDPGDLFAGNFYKEKEGLLNIDNYRGFKIHTSDTLAEHEGYYCREVDQTEQFFLEERFWEKIYPQDLKNLAIELKNISIIILKNILTKLEIPETVWSQGTGGCTDGNGMYHLTFNHFRPEKEARGLNTHKDSGWVTVLRSTSPGLEALINGQWAPILPKKGYFIINFGCAFEIFTRKTMYPVTAVTHRVLQQKNSKNSDHRFSYALFSDNSLDENKCKGLYEYDGKNSLLLKMNFKTFLNDILKNTYQEDTVGLY